MYHPLPKAAVIGLGNMGRNHARIYHQLGCLTAVADINPHTAHNLGQRYHVPSFTHLDDLLSKTSPDVITLAVPTPDHFLLAQTCLQHRLPVLVEKPITDNLAHARALVSLARKNQTYLMVGHVERFNPVVIQLKRLIDQGKFGRLVSLLAIRVGVNPPSTPHSDVVIDLGIHDIDICNYLLNALPTSYQVTRQQVTPQMTADAAAISLTYRHTTAMIQVNWITPIKIRRLYVTGTNLFAQVDYISQRIVMLDKLLIKPHLTYRQLTSYTSKPQRTYYASQSEPLAQELKFFLAHAHDPVDVVRLRSALNALKIAIDHQPAQKESR